MTESTNTNVMTQAEVAATVAPVNILIVDESLKIFFRWKAFSKETAALLLRPHQAMKH